MRLLVEAPIFIILAAVVSAVSNQNLIKCNESCIPLMSCPSLKGILNKNRNKTWIHTEEYDEIRRYYCLRKGDTYYVCCPRILVNENPLTRSFIAYNASVKQPYIGTYFNSHFTVYKPAEVNSEDPFAECGRTFNRNYQTGYNTELSDFPWLALLEFNTGKGKKLGCGGVLISDRHVLTAAHCVTSRSHNFSSVLLGRYDTEVSSHCVPDSNLGRIICTNLSQKFQASKIIMHESYHDGIEFRQGEKVPDIALIKLKHRVKFNPYIKPICLPLSKPNVDTYLVSGWGRSLIPKASGFCQKFMSRLTLVDLETCMKNAVLPFISDEHICAGTPELSEHPCISDGGGPLMGYERKPSGAVRMTVFGVSFMDLACNQTETTSLPGVFTSLYEYVPWVLDKLKE